MTIIPCTDRSHYEMKLPFLICIMDDEQQYRNTKVVLKANQTIYGMGFLGAAVYFIVHAASFWMGVAGFIKALFWPAVLVYEIFERLKL